MLSIGMWRRGGEIGSPSTGEAGMQDARHAVWAQGGMGIFISAHGDIAPLHGLGKLFRIDHYSFFYDTRVSCPVI